MSSGARKSLIILCIAYCCALNAAVGDDSSVRPIQIGQWIQQLGDESFEVRENASLQLSELGLAAKSELLAGLRGGDPEIRWRCAKLWAAVRDTDFQLRAEAFLNDPEGVDNHEFPDWDRYRKLFGTSRVARQTFLSLQKEESSLWEESASAEDTYPRRFLERCRQVRSILKNQQGRMSISGSTALTVVYLGIRYESLISEEDRQLIKELWRHSAIVDLVSTDNAWSAIQSRWLRGGGDQRSAFERMMDGLRYVDDSAAPIARELLRDPATPPNQKQFALLALAKYRLAEDDKLVQVYLDDASPIETFFSRGVVIKSQLRDIALASLIVRAGKNPADFGFKYLRPDDRVLFSPSTLGFKDEEQRFAAFEKWIQSASKPSGAD
ncbi:hypothetical protein Psta_4070 [Pirellula staleyi DSM 6068]|uniref:PBS lyase HEAT domain protein repeat-containing protein n=1 Tax=Pirellula staleyi (strain ATCC 27377 / DSM 6068 / ICPB 4128) TaxID=530564 RepID=D2R2Y9_PIRSD|nr:hypothetical protein Psta_4070 [Pirellula staleyi DSM 6068]